MDAVNFVKGSAKAVKGMNEAAQAEYTKVLNAVKKEVIPNERLLGMPASDLFEKAETMSKESFWNDPNNIAQFARGELMARTSTGGNLELPNGEFFEYRFQRGGELSDRLADFDKSKNYIRLKDSCTGTKVYLEDSYGKYPIVKIISKDGTELTPKGLSEAAQNTVDRARARANGNYFENK